MIAEARNPDIPPDDWEVLKKVAGATFKRHSRTAVAHASQLPYEWFLNSAAIGWLGCRDRLDKTNPGWKHLLEMRARGAVLDEMRELNVNIRHSLTCRGEYPAQARTNCQWSTHHVTDGEGMVVLPEVPPNESKVDAADAFDMILSLLPPNERALIDAVFRKDISQADIARQYRGRRTGRPVCESYISQVLSEILAKLRRHPRVRAMMEAA